MRFVSRQTNYRDSRSSIPKGLNSSSRWSSPLLRRAVAGENHRYTFQERSTPKGLHNLAGHRLLILIETKRMSFLMLHYHVVFSTKNREPFLGDAWRLEMHRYLGGLTKKLGGHCDIVGGTADHVHLLISLWARPALPDFMRELKRSSSLWAHRNPKRRDFKWQDEYAAITVSPSDRMRVRHYIENQEKHHAPRGYIDELKIILTKAGVDFDERYLG